MSATHSGCLYVGPTVLLNSCSSNLTIWLNKIRSRRVQADSRCWLAVGVSDLYLRKVRAQARRVESKHTHYEEGKWEARWAVNADDFGHARSIEFSQVNRSDPQDGVSSKYFEAQRWHFDPLARSRHIMAFSTE